MGKNVFFFFLKKRGGVWEAREDKESWRKLFKGAACQGGRKPFASLSEGCHHDLRPDLKGRRETYMSEGRTSTRSSMGEEQQLDVSTPIEARISLFCVCEEL